MVIYTFKIKTPTSEINSTEVGHNFKDCIEILEYRLSTFFSVDDYEVLRAEKYEPIEYNENKDNENL